jgi:hypothetical protein
LSNLVIKVTILWIITPVLSLNFATIYGIWSEYDAGKDYELVAVSNNPT